MTYLTSLTPGEANFLDKIFLSGSIIVLCSTLPALISWGVQKDINNILFELKYAFFSCNMYIVGLYKDYFEVKVNEKIIRKIMELPFSHEAT